MGHIDLAACTGGGGKISSLHEFKEERPEKKGGKEKIQTGINSCEKSEEGWVAEGREDLR